MDFHWSLRDSKSPQVSRTALSILAGLKNAVVSMASAHPLFSISSGRHHQVFGDNSERINYNWHQLYFHITLLF